MIFNATQVWFGLRVDLILAFFSVIVIFTSILLHNSTGKLTVTRFNSNTKDIAFVFTRNTLQFLVFTIALKKTKACTQKRDLHVIRDERLQFKADRVAMAICFGYLAGFIIIVIKLLRLSKSLDDRRRHSPPTRVHLDLEFSKQCPSCLTV